ncbi:MAG: outer membrane protein assembly factor BamE [Lautropia sp.]
MIAIRLAPSTPRAPAAPAALAALLAAALLAGCSSADRSKSGFLEPYRFAIPQGNYLNQQMLNQVREGMSREQVRLAIGTPLLNDVFHADRWDYVFRFQHPNGAAELRRVIIEFRNERVASIRAIDPLPQRDDPTDPALPGYRPPERT